MLNISKSIILSLIKEDIKIYRIRKGLQQIGFEADGLYTELTDIVLLVLGFEGEVLNIAFDRYYNYLQNLDIHKLADENFIESSAKEVFEILDKFRGEELI